MTSLSSTPVTAAEPADPPDPAQLPPLRRQPAYRLWWGADTSALLAGSIYQFAIPLILLAATGSPAQAGVLAALGTICRVATTLLGGSLADRAERSGLMVLSGTIGALLAGTLALLFWSNAAGVAVLALVHILLELRSGLFGSVTNAALKDVVHPMQLGRAMAANEGRDAALMLGGAPLGGLLLGLGPAFALLVVALGQAGAALFGRRLGLVFRADAAHQIPAGPPSARGIRAGLRWFLARPQLRIMLWVVIAINLGSNGAITALVYGLRVRGESPAAIGLASAGMGVGLLAGSLAATWLIEKIRTGWLTCLSLTWMSTFLLLLAARGELWWIGLMLGLAYAGVPALNAAVGGYILALAPRDMAGRANSVVVFMALLAMPLAPGIAGTGIEFLGLASTLVGFAAITTSATVACWASGRIRSIPGPSRWLEHGMAATPHPASADNASHALVRAAVRERERARYALHARDQWIHL